MSLKKILFENISLDINEDQKGLWSIKIKKDGSTVGSAELEEFYDYNWDVMDIMTREEFNKYFPSGVYLSIRDIEIKRTYRGKGYAKQAMKKIIEFAKKEGHDRIHLNASSKDKWHGLNFNNLVKFYKKFGFEVIKEGRKNAVMIKKL